MDPAEILSVRFHFGGEFVHIGKELDYVGGDEEISEIERDKMSLQEVIGFLKGHMEVKDSVKLYFLPPGKELANGLVFLYDDAGCVKMSEQITDGRVADIYVEYHAEQDMVSISSGSDFEDEIVSLGDSDESEVPEVITAEDEVAETITIDVDDNVPVVAVDQIEPEAMVDNVLVPDDNGVITQVMTSPGKRIRGRTIVLESSQVCGVVKSWEPVTNPIDGTHTGFGFCEFESAEGSLRAMRLLNKLSVDGQELVLNVNQATRDYFQKYGESTPEEKAKEAETETRDGVVSLADNGNDLSRATPEVKAKEAETETRDGVVSSAENGNDLSRAILDVTRRGAVVMQRIRSLIEGETKRCQADKDVMERIHSLIEERMKSKLLVSPTPVVQVPACIVDENGDDDTGSGALEERKIRRQCEQEEHLGERKAVGSEGQKDREMTAAGMSSLQIGEAPSMHVPMNRESTVEHERKSQHRERDGFRNRNGEEKGRQRKAVGSESRKDREVTAAGKSSLQIDEAPSMHVRMECKSTVEHDRKSQLRGRDGFRKSNCVEKGRERKSVGSEAPKDREVTASGKSSLQLDVLPSMHVPMECESTVVNERKIQHMERDGFTKSNGEEKHIVFVPGLVSDKQNISARERVGFELQATSNSGEKTTLDAKQLLATVPKTKEELFSHDVNWAIYDEYGLHKRMRPWISKKATEVFDEELAEFVDYVVACIKEHVNAPRMLDLLESLLDDDAEKFVALTWRKLIFEIKKVEEGLA
ncbi:hypothetical protein ACQ4PT_007900 [Festuca glaucescens]